MMNMNQLLHRAIQNAEKTDYAGVMELWVNEANLLRYNTEIVKKLSMYVVVGARVLEFGAGIGTLAKIWTKEKKIKPICLEIDQNLQEIIEKRGFTCHRNLEEIEGQFDLIYSSNVLEHIENDQLALQGMYQKLKPGGILALYLPAFQFLYSEFDAAIGHYRRYEKRDILNKLKRTHFSIKKCEYADSIGFLAWLTTKRNRYDQKKVLDNSAKLQLYDNYIFPISNFLDAWGMKYVLGKNLFILAKKSIDNI